MSAPPLPDLVRRDFSVGEPGERTCGDITYIATDEGWLYLADVLDLGSRRLVGYAMGERMPYELVAGALDMAVATRGGDVAGMVFHHDRGAQYMATGLPLPVRQAQDHPVGGAHRLVPGQRGGRVVLGELKRELISRYRFASRADARRAIIAWINHYNAVRLHSSLGNVPPIEWELRYARRDLLAA